MGTGRVKPSPRCWDHQTRRGLRTALLVSGPGVGRRGGRLSGYACPPRLRSDGLPEGDTVWRTARRLHDALAGVPITQCEIRWGSRPTPDVLGRDTLEVVSHGKHLLHRIDGGITIHSHLRMEGAWRVHDQSTMTPQSLYNRQIRALVGTQNKLALGLRLGMLDVIRTRAENRIVGHLGPDILGADWDLDRAVAAIQADPRPIGEALLDQANIAGIGTMYCAETLFILRVPPWSTAASLGAATVQAVVQKAAALLQVNKDFAVQSTTGSRRRGYEHYVHPRSGRECRRCGEVVRVAMIGKPPTDRTMFYCPHCQGGLGPTDDGKAQSPLGVPKSRGYGQRRIR